MGEAGRPGAQLLDGRYRLVEQLGAGGMSVVWRGYDEVLGRQVAVKVLASRLASDRAFRHRIRIEAQAAARLCHPNITNVYDYGESEQVGLTVPYVVMELIEGESLTSRLHRVQQLPWREAVTIGAEVASALAAAHARGVVHRDVTPGNVMLTATGAKVVDFGISAIVGESENGPDGHLLGTPAYLAPERLDGGPVSPATDVYALGLQLYRMLTGRLPWAASTTTQMLRAHLAGDPEPMPAVAGLPDEVADLVHRCLAKLPADRPNTATVAQTLAEAAGVLAVVPVSPAAMSAGAVDSAMLANAGTTILPWSTDTDALPVSGWRTRRAERRRHRLQIAAVSAGLVGITGAMWAFTAQSPASTDGGEPTEATMAMRQTAPCQVRYLLRKDSGKTFDAEVTVTNTGARELRDWAVSFSFPGDQRITDARAASWEQRGQTVVLRSADPDTPLPTGASRDLALTGRYDSTNPLPVEFQLGGATCAAQIVATSGAPATQAGGVTPVRHAKDRDKGPSKARTPGGGEGAGFGQKDDAKGPSKGKGERGKK